MTTPDPEKLNHLEKLKSKLFSKNFNVETKRSGDFPHYEEQEVVSEWPKQMENFPDMRAQFLTKTSMFKKFFTFSIVFFILALGYSAFVFFGKNNTVSNNHIDISVLSNAFTNGGEEYPLLLEIVNKNNAALLLADLVIQYPRSSQDSLSSDNDRIRLSLGTIDAGSVREENVKLVLFGEQGGVRPIKIMLEYRVEGSNAIFVKEKLFDVAINSTPLNISVSAPSETTSNKEFTMIVSTTLNATESASDMLLKVDYPLGFQFIEAKPKPSFANNVWSFGDMAPGVERKVEITGRMIDVYETEEKIFHIWSGSHNSSDKYSIETVYNSLEHNLLIGKSSIETRLVFNGSSARDFASNTQTTIQGQIYWTNNLDSKITDLEITAKIGGNAVDRRTIKANQGFYNSSQDILVWDKNSVRGFSEIEPGQGGVVSFQVSSLPLFSTSSGLLSSPVITIDVSTRGRQTGGASELSNRESRTIRMISDVGFSNKALFYSGPFTNSGAMPPKAESKTTYTVTWTLSNTSNNVSKSKVIATIPSWVSFTGKVSPSSEDVSYNSSTREITWNIGSISSGTSITKNPREVSFQVELLPSLSQIGTNPILINGATLTGHDDFANVDIKLNKASLDTRILNDTSVPPNNGRVIE